MMDDQNPTYQCTPVPCPSFEEVRMEIGSDVPEPGAFARAAFGDEWTERTARGYAERRQARRSGE